MISLSFLISVYVVLLIDVASKRSWQEYDAVSGNCEGIGFALGTIIFLNQAFLPPFFKTLNPFWGYFWVKYQLILSVVHVTITLILWLFDHGLVKVEGLIV